MFPPLTTAASLFPLEELAIEAQFADDGAPPVCAVHVATFCVPAFEVSQMFPGLRTAATLVPSEELAR